MLDRIRSSKPSGSGSASGEDDTESSDQGMISGFSSSLRKVGVSSLTAVLALTMTTQTALAQTSGPNVGDPSGDVCNSQLVTVVDTAMTVILGVGWLFPAMAAGAFFLLAGTTSNVEKRTNYKSSAKNAMYMIGALLGFSVFIDLFTVLFSGVDIIGCMDVFPF